MIRRRFKQIEEIIMDTDYLKKAFLDGLSEKMKINGFKYVKAKSAYVRKTPFGEQRYFILFTKWHEDDGVYVETGMQVRFDDVEKFYHETSYFEEKYHKITDTIGMGLANWLRNGLDYEIFLQDEQDVAEAIEYYYKLYREAVEPFFDTCNTLESLHVLLNSEPEKRLSIINFIHRGKYGLIVAHLLNVDNKKMKELTKIYSHQYATMTDEFYKLEFDKVVANIAEHKIREKQNRLNNRQNSQQNKKTHDHARADFEEKENSTLTLTEVKNSTTSPLSKTQKQTFPQIENSVRIIRGLRGMHIGLKSGDKIPITEAESIWPDDVTDWENNYEYEPL
jgi:hypothetical protein